MFVPAVVPVANAGVAPSATTETPVASAMRLSVLVIFGLVPNKMAPVNSPAGTKWRGDFSADNATETEFALRSGRDGLLHRPANVGNVFWARASPSACAVSDFKGTERTPDLTTID